MDPNHFADRVNNTYALWKPRHKLEEIVEQFKKGEMPLTSLVGTDGSKPG